MNNQQINTVLQSDVLLTISPIPAHPHEISPSPFTGLLPQPNPCASHHYVSPTHPHKAHLHPSPVCHRCCNRCQILIPLRDT